MGMPTEVAGRSVEQIYEGAKGAFELNSARQGAERQMRKEGTLRVVRGTNMRAPINAHSHSSQTHTRMLTRRRTPTETQMHMQTRTQMCTLTHGDRTHRE